MTKEERTNLKDRFAAIGKQLDATIDLLLSLESENQRLSTTSLYTTLLESVKTAEDSARELADYIDHATDENWKEAGYEDEKLPATLAVIAQTPLTQQEWNRVNDTEPWVTSYAADKIEATQLDLASYLDVTAEQALLILVETLCQRRLSE